MEFNIEINLVIGIVSQRRGEDSARIKVLGFKNNDNKYTEFKYSELLSLFPHEGYIFEPGYFKNAKFKSSKEGDLIEFKVTSIENSDEGLDHFRIENNQAKKIGQRAFELKDINIKIHEVDFSNARISNVDFSDRFYGVIDNYIVGKLKLHQGKISPSISKEVRKWELKYCEIVKSDSAIYLISEPLKENGIILDAMDNEQLFEWFRDKLKLVNQSVVKELDENSQWRVDIPKYFKKSDDDIAQLEAIRFRRVESNFDKFAFTVKEIKELTNVSEKLHSIYSSIIEKHKNELKTEYASEIEVIKNQNQIEKQLLEKQLANMELDIIEKQSRLSSLNVEVDSFKSRIEEIKANKERILSDFSIIQEVFGHRASTSRNVGVIIEESFVVETEIPNLSSIQISQKDKFLARLKYFVNHQNLNFSLADSLIPVITSNRGVFLNRIELGLAFIEATGNAKYIIQQVEPDWLHFEDLWKKGLEVMWNSSHSNPDVLHFLILEDLNLSSPECYMRPLLDCMNGIRKNIPFSKTPYPNNLRILATKISSDEPKIGLPLYQQTFINWGAIGFIGNIEKPADQTALFVDGYLNVATIATFIPDEFDLKIISSQVEREFDKLFDKN